MSIKAFSKPFNRFFSLAVPVCLMATVTQTVSAYSHWRVTSEFASKAHFINTINNKDAQHRRIDGLAVTAGGQWMLIDNDKVNYSSGFNVNLRNAVKNYVSQGHRVVAADCNKNGGCVVIYDNWGRHYLNKSKIPAALITKLNQYQSKGWKVRDAEITNTGYVLLGPGNVASWSGAGVDNDLEAALRDRLKSKRQINNVEIGFNGQWALMADHNPMYEGVSEQLKNRLQTISQSTTRVDTLKLGVGSNYLVYSGGSDVKPNTVIGAIEYGLGADGKTSIWQRMKELNIPGASIAIIAPGVSNPKVTLSRGYGVKKVDQQLPILSSTSFDIASLSKYLTSLALMDQLDSQNRLSDLDSNLFTLGSNQLASWKWRGENNQLNNNYGIPDNPNLGNDITLRRLLSHTAAINNRVTMVRQNAWSNTKLLLSSRDVLLGAECNSLACDKLAKKNPAWRLPTSEVLAPGAEYQYSNSGYRIVQAYMEDSENKDFSAILAERVFDPLGMSRTTAKTVVPNSILNNAAWQHDTGAVGGTPRSTRFTSLNTAAGGVWASSEDYAKAMIVALNEGRSQYGIQIISQAAVDELLTRIRLNNGNAVGYGLGVGLSRDVTESNDGTFIHTGAHSMMTRTLMAGKPSTDEGIVVLANAGDLSSPAPQNVATFRSEVLEAYKKAVGWD